MHAIAQVAHLRLGTPETPENLVRSINAHLPADINILSVHSADDRFHARHHAVSRSYLYQISRRRTAFAKRYVWWIETPLDLAAMREATLLCIGEHDFTHFCDPRTDPADAHVRLDRIEIAQNEALVLLRFTASHFAWRMIRRLTGTLVELGRGNLTLQAFTELLDAPASQSPPISTSTFTAPASGLFLESVRYGNDADIPPLKPAFPIAH